MSGGPPSMPAPVCLIENTDRGLQTVGEALDILQGIRQPVVVVAVVGLYRTGKSYLMNRLAGQTSGFALGSAIESKTKGIWMWCVPHPSKPGHTLVLLDTEGLGDVDKGDSKNDAWIFCLAVLLSSTLVYNSRGTIDNQAVEQLHYVTELTNKIRTKSEVIRDDDGEEVPQDTEFVRFFPGFVWAVRDFTLERKIDGRDVSDDGYLDFALQLKTGLSMKVLNYNLPRQCIRNFFPTRKCFTFPFPTTSENMKRLDSMSESELCPDFLHVAKQFCNYVFTESSTKTVQGGHKVTGSRFSHLVKIYVDTINSGEIPCLENAVVAMAEIENQSAINEGLRLYEQGMEQLKAEFPTDLETLSAEHHRLSSMATQEFLKHSFKDKGGKYMAQLSEKIAKLSEQLTSENMEASEKLCRKLLSELYAAVAANVEQGAYAKPGGYAVYRRDRDAMEVKYRQHGKKGMKGEEMLEEFLQEKNAEANSILMADERLTDAEKTMAENAQQEALLMQAVRAAEEDCQRLESLMQEERRSHEENLNRLKEKREEELALLAAEQQRALESKLREQEEVLRRGFTDQQEVLQAEIQQLRREQREREREEARIRSEEKRQNTREVVEAITSTFGHYCDYKQAKEQRRLEQQTARTQKYSYLNKRLKTQQQQATKKPNAGSAV